MNMKEIGETIRVMRLSRNLTQGEVASLTGLSQSSIAAYESGTRRPSDAAAEALADVFNVPKWAIFYDEDEMTPINPDGALQSDERPKWIKLSAGRRVLTDAQLDLIYGVAHEMNPTAFPLDDEGKKDDE